MIQNFSAAAPTYDQHAALQRDTAAQLAARLEKLDLPTGEVLEIGCGTGLFTQHLCRLFPERWLTITDICPTMLSHCWQRLYADLPQRARLRLLDGEQVEGTYALITANLVFQWYTDLERSLERALRALKPGGHLACTYLVDGSFPEWQEACAASGIPFTANPLPPTTGTPEQRRYTYANALDFFRALKGIGAHTSLHAVQLPPTALRTLSNHWQEPCTVTYNVLELVIQT